MKTAAARTGASQFVRFSIIGVIGFVVDSTVLMIALQFGLGLYLGRVVSFLVAATVTWSLNRRFTFTVADHRPLPVQWARFVAANSLGGAGNYAIYATLVTFVPFVTARPVLGVAAGAVASLTFNFTVNKFWVFRAAKTSPPPSASESRGQ